MWEWIRALPATESVFFFAALAGTFFFLIRMVLMLVAGMDGDGLSANVDAHGHHGIDASESFKLFSIQSVTAFFMMFGWIGLSSRMQYELSFPVSLLLALLAGSLSMLLIAWLFKLIAKLACPGEAYVIGDVVGLTAKVYQRIPAVGTGKVQVIVKGCTREVEAIAEKGVEIESFQNVKIVRVVSSNTVAVE